VTPAVKHELLVTIYEDDIFPFLLGSSFGGEERQVSAQELEFTVEESYFRHADLIFSSREHLGSGHSPPPAPPPPHSHSRLRPTLIPCTRKTHTSQAPSLLILHYLPPPPCYPPSPLIPTTIPTRASLPSALGSSDFLS
jgi:hypothetical protein